MDEWTLRLIILFVGALLLLWIWFSGQPRKPRRERRSRRPEPGIEEVPSLRSDDGEASALPRWVKDAKAGTTAVEDERAGCDDWAEQRSTQPGAEAEARAPQPGSERVDSRLPSEFEKVVVLHVIARDAEGLRGADLVVAAEKAGLSFAAPGVFYRFHDARSDAPPVFTVANMVKPGTIDLGNIDTLRLPGLTFIMTLPGPLSALDGWDIMLPTAQRLADLLDGLLLDEEHNALGRQGIAHMRDQLRAWDRRHGEPEPFTGLRS